MTLIRSTKFTPEKLITAPRRSTPTPNAAGSHAIYSITTYDLEAHKDYKQTRVLNIERGYSTLLSDNSSNEDPQWLGDTDQILYQRTTDNGETELWASYWLADNGDYFVGKIPTAITELKTVQLKNGDIGITFSAPTNSKGQLFNSKTADSPKHTGIEYSTHPVRIWDTWNPYYRFSLYYNTISSVSEGVWKLNKGSAVNALKGTKIQYPLGPGGVLGESGSYVVGCCGILLCTAKPDQNLAYSTISRAYFIRIDSFEEKRPKVVQLKTPQYVGSASSPAFSIDGKKAAFVVDRTEFASACEKGIAIFDIEDEAAYETSEATTKLIKFGDDKKVIWDRFPGELTWSHNSKTLFIQAEDSGYVRLFSLDLTRALQTSVTTIKEPPRRLTEEGALSSFALLDRRNDSGYQAIISSNSYTEPNLYSVLNIRSDTTTSITSILNSGADLGLDRSQIEDITCPGEKADIQTFIVRPSFFDSNKKYPVALLIHGGPQSAWNDTWSTRWNPALWAEQGYIAVCPNPSGSTGFGLEVCKSVLGDWGGRPYRDIVAVVDYVKEKFPYADTSNMIMGGGSYGGFMANWIAGHPLGKRLKAIVSHDGIFHASSMLASDFIPGLGLDVGSDLWKDTKPWEKWSPANYVKDWSTPMLFIHGDKDFRCPINEGLAAYSIAQAMGVPSRLLFFPTENHWVLGRENSLKWHNTVFGWINHYTGIKDGVQLQPALCDAQFEDDEEEKDEV